MEGRVRRSKNNLERYYTEMAPFPKSLRELCTPAALYFVVSMVALVIVIWQNLGHSNSYHVGGFSCRVPSTFLVIVFKLISILFWTYVLNLICKDGHVGLSWFLVLLPWVLLLILAVLLMMNM